MEDSKFLFDIMIECIKQNKISILFLQETFSIGFIKASKIIDVLEDKGIISKEHSDGTREIYIDLNELNQMYENGQL